MFERFTNQSRRVVVLAQEEARKLDHNYIGTEHLLLGLLREGKGSAAQALTSMGVTLEASRSQVELIIGRGQSEPSGHIPFTPRAKKSLELSLREALQLGHDYIGTGHLLLGLTRQGDNMAVRILGNLHVNLGDLRRQVTSEMAADPERQEETREPGGQTPWVRLRERDMLRGVLDTIEARLSAIEEHLGITRPEPDEVRQLDEKIAKVRQDKESAIDVQDFGRAAVLRDSEKQLLAERERVIAEMAARRAQDAGAAVVAEAAGAGAVAAARAGAVDAEAAAATDEVSGTDQIAGSGADGEDPPAAAG